MPGELDELIELLAGAHERARPVMLTAPDGADGDSIGSQLALQRILRVRFPGLDVAIVNADELPRRYSGLRGAEGVENPESRAGTEFAVALVLDGGYERIGAAQALFDAADRKILFDHHALGDAYPYDLEIVDAEAAATAELVDRLRKHPAIDVQLDEQMAEPMYAALIFDTGFFKHSCTTPETLQLAAELVATGIDFTRIGEDTMLRRRPAGLALLARVLGRVETRAAGRVVYSTLLTEDLVATGADGEDRDGIIDNLFLVDGCDIGVLLTEVGSPGIDDVVVRCSFRSRCSVDVAAVARSLTSRGGGHRKAAGCSLEGDLETWLPKVMTTLEEAIHAIPGVT